MRSIALKLWLGMMSLVIVVLLLLWFFQIVFLEKFYAGIRIAEIKNQGYSIIKQLESGNELDFKNQVEQFSYKNNLNIEMFDQEGRGVLATGIAGPRGAMPMMVNGVIADSIQQVVKGKEIILSLDHPRFGNQIVVLGLPVKIAGQLKGALYISIPLLPVEDTASILKKQLFYVTIILLLAALILSYTMARSFTKPILKITKGAEEIAAGNFSEKIDLKNKDEIGRLAATINNMAQGLSKIEQLRKDLIANVSHELRTPLSLVRGYAETIRDVSGEIPEKREKHIGLVIEEAERLSKIVDDILNLSQMQAGYHSLNISHFAIHTILEEVVKRFAVLSESTGVQIALKNMEETTAVADQARIEQVLYNLINNAFNHTEKGGSIEIKAVHGEENVRIEVSDTGVGIPQQDLEHIWERYYKGDKSNGRKNMGTGLGLAIVKNILEAHGFRYGVESKEGVGTTFWFEVKTI